jgi:hypothetical protein
VLVLCIGSLGAALGSPERSGAPQPTATFQLSSPQDGAVVAPGQTVDCRIDVLVSAGDNQGLALASVDLVADPANPQTFALPPAAVPAGMSAFSRPAGLCNPDPTDPWGTGYGGTPVGDAAGDKALLQIGGAQNTFGVAGPCLGPNADVCMGQDVDVETGIGQAPAGVELATVSFSAPAAPGVYTLSLEGAAATVLTALNRPPAASEVSWAKVAVARASISFTVR